MVNHQTMNQPLSFSQALKRAHGLCVVGIIKEEKRRKGGREGFERVRKKGGILNECVRERGGFVRKIDSFDP